MNSTDLKQHIAGAEEALAAFLGMLLGEEVTFKADASEEITLADARLDKMAYLVMLSPADSGSGFAVLLEQPWLPMLSKAMLGEAMEIQDDGADDLVRELAGQGYGSIRNQLGASGVKLPDVSFDILVHGNQVPDGALPDNLWKIPFNANVGSVSLGGVAFLSASASEQAAAPQPDIEKLAAEVGLSADLGQAAMGGGMGASPVPVTPASFPELGSEGIGGDGDNFSLLAEVELEVSVELGRRKLPLADVLRLTTGSVIELENLVGEPLEVYANGRLIAEGEAVVIDEQFGIRITRLASDRQRTKAFL